MTTEWLLAFFAAPAAIVVLASMLVFFTRPVSKKHLAKKETSRRRMLEI